MAGKNKRVRTPTILQMEAVECGAASLGMMLAHYGAWVPLEELRVACGVSRDGSKAANMLKAARAVRPERQGLQGGARPGLRALRLPSIVFWNFNHFVVVEGSGAGWVYLNDPASGRRRVTEAEFDASLHRRRADLRARPRTSSAAARRPSLVASLAGRLRGSRTALTFVVLASLVLVIPGLVIPAFTKIFVDEFLVDEFKDWVRPLLLAMGITAVIRARADLAPAALPAASRDAAGAQRGEPLLLARAAPARGVLHPALRRRHRLARGRQRPRRPAPLGLARHQPGQRRPDRLLRDRHGFYDIVLTLIGVSMALLNIVALRFVARKREDANRRLLQDQGKLMAASMNGLQTIETLKASGAESDFFARWAGYQAKVVNTQQELGVPNLVVGTLPGRSPRSPTR